MRRPDVSERNRIRNRKNAPRFEDRYIPEPNTGCWLWLGAVQKKGYGHICRDGTTLAHRWSWMLHFGSVPIGLHVLHRCDQPSCVNPAHLFVGTNQDNVDDKVRKGRHRKNKEFLR